MNESDTVNNRVDRLIIERNQTIDNNVIKLEKSVNINALACVKKVVSITHNTELNIKTMTTRITKAGLIESMLAYQPEILQAKAEFLSNEINHSQDIWVHTEHQDKYLVDFYQEIEWTYYEIDRRYAKRPVQGKVTIPSKINKIRADNKHFRGNHNRRIIDKETGRVYFGYRKAANAIGMEAGTLSAMLNGQNKNTTNLRHA